MVKMTETSTPGASGVSGRDRLLEAASHEFARAGFAGASVAAIAERAAVGKSTLFHHFESKQALYRAVVRAAAGEFGQKLDHLLASTDDPARCLCEFQCQHLAHISRNREVARLILRELQEADSPDGVALVRDELAPNFQRLVDYLSLAARHGRIRSDVDFHATALTMFSANVMYFQARSLLCQMPGFDLAADAEGYARSVAQLVYQGLANEH